MAFSLDFWGQNTHFGAPAPPHRQPDVATCLWLLQCTSFHEVSDALCTCERCTAHWCTLHYFTKYEALIHGVLVNNALEHGALIHNDRPVHADSAAVKMPVTVMAVL